MGAQRPSLARRWFGPMGKGSLRSGLLVLTTTALGAGVLTLPFAFRELGWLVGSAVVTVLAVINVASLELLLDAGIEYGANSYSELLVAVRGPYTATVLDASVSAITWGAIIAYWIFIKQLLPTLLAELFGLSPAVARAEVVLPVLAVLIFFIALPRDITAIGKLSMIGMVSVSYVGCLLVYSAATFGVGLGSLPASMVSGVGDPSKEETTVARLSNACALVVAGFLCQYNVFFVYSDVKQPTVRRLRKITRISTFLQAVFYLTLGLGGFATFGRSTRDNIYMNFAPGNLAVMLGQLLVCASLCVSIPLCVFAARSNLVSFLTRCLPPDVQEKSPGGSVSVPHSPSLSVLSHAVGQYSRKCSIAFDLREEDGVHCDNPILARSRASSWASLHAPECVTTWTPPVEGTCRLSDPLLDAGTAKGHLPANVLAAPYNAPDLPRAQRARAHTVDVAGQLEEGWKAKVQRVPSMEEVKVAAEPLDAAGWALHMTATGCIIGLTLALAFAVPSVSFLLGKLGGACGVTQMYLMPALILLRRPDLRPPAQRAATLVGFAAASAVGLTALLS